MRSIGSSGLVRRADLVLPERLDVTTVGDLRDALVVAVESAPDVDVVVDVSGVRVVDSVGLGLLVTTHRNCLRSGRRLLLVDPQPRLLRLLAVTRLHRILYLQRAVDLTGPTGASWSAAAPGIPRQGVGA
jgi:anti-anti-sigma factor